MKIFNKILVANRGEIAVRIFRTLRKMGINSVAIYSSRDEASLHCQLADEAYLIKGELLSETYLNSQKILEIAKNAGADAIHPGYGFLSENAEFSRMVAEAGINFIGPPGEVIDNMGNKLRARTLARNAGVPLIEGYEGSVEEILNNISEFELPLIVKAAAGGGGKAMRIVRNKEDFKEALETTGREALNYFGDNLLYVEKYFENGRHIEIQVLVDHYGNILIPGERECSIQRRHQKVIEETPSKFINRETRERMFDVSGKLVREIGYVNAGTLEFLVDEKQNFYFLEMNTRIQVEHPVTEETTGIDLVEQQILIAAGNKLQILQKDVKISGHSIQARLYAEDPEKAFLPSPGEVFNYMEPRLPGLRIDSGINEPVILYPDFDPMISKVIATAPSREEAIRLLQKALFNYVISGVTTNREFIISLLSDQDFTQNKISTTWLEKKRESILEHWKTQRERSSNSLIFAIWLSAVLFTRRTIGNNPWHNVGYWRHHVKKSFFYEDKQFNIDVNVRKSNKFTFTTEGAEHEVELIGVQKQLLLILVDGIWSSGYVTFGRDVHDIVHLNGYTYRLKPLDYLPSQPFLRAENIQLGSGPQVIKSPLHGRIIKINSGLNQEVKRGDTLFTLDAMKIENRINSPFQGRISEVKVKEGEQVSINQDILIIDIPEK